MWCFTGLRSVLWDCWFAFRSVNVRGMRMRTKWLTVSSQQRGRHHRIRRAVHRTGAPHHPSVNTYTDK